MEKNSALSRSILYFSAIVISLAGIKIAAAIVVPFLLSVFVAIVCNPAIQFLERRKLPRFLAIIFVILFIILLFVVLGGVIGTSVKAFSEALPIYEAQISGDIDWLITWMGNNDMSISMMEIRGYFDPSKVMGLVTSTLKGFSGVLGNVFLLLVTVIFMLLEGPSFAKKMKVAFNGSENKKKNLEDFLTMVNQYMAIKTAISLATGVIIGFVLWLLNVDFFVLWALLAFLLNYIPNIGSALAAIPAVILTFLQLGPIYAGVVIALFVSVNMVMGNVVEPRLMGRSLGLSTLVVFLSLIFWGWLLGMVGMLLSVPLTMIFKIALENSAGGSWFAVLLSSDEEVQLLSEQLKENE